MFTSAEQQKALELFIESRHSEKIVLKELGYPPFGECVLISPRICPYSLYNNTYLQIFRFPNKYLLEGLVGYIINFYILLQYTIFCSILLHYLYMFTQTIHMVQ